MCGEKCINIKMYFLVYLVICLLHISSHLPGLEKDLRDSLIGQHIVSDVVLKAVSSYMTDSNPNKPLVLSFHGTTGVGKIMLLKSLREPFTKMG